MVIAPATVDRASAMAMALIMVRKLIVAVGTEIGTVVGTTGTNSGSVFSPETRLLLTSWRASPVAGLSFVMRLSSVAFMQKIFVPWTNKEADIAYPANISNRNR